MTLMAVCAMPPGCHSTWRPAARVLGLPQQKDTEGSKLTLGLSRMNRKRILTCTPKNKLTRVYDYCLQDINTEVALLDEIGCLPPGETRPWLAARSEGSTSGSTN